jgi:hypothetical protein
MRIPSHKLSCGLSSVLLALWFGWQPCRAQAHSPGVSDQTAAANFRGQDSAPAPLPSEAAQIARILGVEREMSSLAAFSRAKEPSTSPETSLQILTLHEQVTESVVKASLDVDSAQGQIDNERNQILELHNILTAHRGRALGNTNLAAFAAGAGLGIVGGLLQLSNVTSDAGQGVDVAAGAISSMFTLRNFRQTHRLRRPGWTLPALLAAFLAHDGRQPAGFPDDVWAYLNSAPPNAEPQRTRKGELLASWTAAGRLGVAGTPKSKKTIELLTTSNSGDKRIDIDLLNERDAMLADVQAQVGQMKRDLASLMQSLNGF